MFQVRAMRVDDFPFAVQLANTMNWNMAEEDFEFMASLEPHGNFIALDDGKPIGIATCISFGTVGWFGNLIVKEQYRSKGVGSLLVKHASRLLAKQRHQSYRSLCLSSTNKLLW